jgi:hypothetical protein
MKEYIASNLRIEERIKKGTSMKQVVRKAKSLLRLSPYYVAIVLQRRTLQ